MSHHLDTPEAAERGQLFVDDLFVFDRPGSTVFVLDVNSNVNGSVATPDFWPGAHYEVKVARGESLREDLTLRVVFGEPDTDGGQAYRLHVLTGEQAAGGAGDGEVLLEGRTGHAASGGGVQAWTGRARDPFFFDLSLLEPVSSAVTGGTALDLSGWDPSAAENTFGDKTVASIVLEVPLGVAGLDAGTAVSVWAVTRLSDGEGGLRQVNHAGLPMMWPIFWPDDTDFSASADSRHPADDASADASAFAQSISASAEATGAVADPQALGAAVVAAVFPDVLRYELGTPAAFGTHARNGRALADNAPQVMLSLVTGTAIDAGLTADAAAGNRSDAFPYVVPAG